VPALPYLQSLTMMPPTSGRIGILLAPFLLVASLSPGASAQTPVVREMVVDPVAVHLSGPQASYSLLVHGKTADGQSIDLTRAARFQSLRPELARVTQAGVIHAKADGITQITVEAAGHKGTVTVKVTGSSQARTLHFENDIVPLLSRFGCNSAGCHGGAEGQNGFKLSVFGSDPVADFAALVKEARGRRLLFTAPEHSLFLAKASGAVAHGGGIRLPRDGAEFELIRAWIATGAPWGDPAAPRVAAIRVEPRERLMAMKGQQQLRVIARYPDGREIDVTAYAKFQSNHEALAAVNADGLVSVGETPGEVAIMASYLNHVDIFRVLVPRPGKIANYPKVPENNFIDTLVFRKLRQLNILPCDLAEDAEYLRRVYLDVIGTLPTPAEIRQFLADKRPDKRSLVVETLLDRPEFADFWALKWADLLRVDRQALGHKRAYAFYRWIRDSLAINKPFDQFAREILTAEGLPDENGPANFYKVVVKPGDRASALSQVFLGMRIACAECHHHPYDRWSQTDYYGMQAFFTPLNFRPTTRGELLQALGDPPTKHPRSGAAIYAFALGTTMPAVSPAGDRRQVLADWLTDPANPWFARNLANRVWKSMLGRGLVEPVDDVRDTNPPSNPELLDALAKFVSGSKFDVKKLIRTIAASRAYQLSSHPNETNAKDEMNCSRSLFRRIDAEVLLDMVSQTTGIGERFTGAAPDTRAIQLWDSKVNHYFLKLFGRPVRASACECERNHEPGIAQVLHLMNAPEIQAKLSHERGTVAKLVRGKMDDRALVEELYLTFFCRPPTSAETATAVKYLGRDPCHRQEAVEDLAWSMLNSLEFVFQH
jgi:hypothetical protein